MRKLVPVRNSIVCKRISGGEKIDDRKSIRIKSKDIDIYEIISLPEINDNGFDFKVGERIISNSTGDEIEINPGETVYLFKTENIMCSVND